MSCVCLLFWFWKTCPDRGPDNTVPKLGPYAIHKINLESAISGSDPELLLVEFDDSRLTGIFIFGIILLYIENETSLKISGHDHVPVKIVRVHRLGK